MSVITLNSVLSGAIFGAALSAAGVYSPTVIIAQMRFEDFHMMKAFLAASASSAIVIILAHKLNLSHCKPRTPSTLAWFSTYDGNILGGALLGCGMALTGACPGTVLLQVATGTPSGPPVLLGGLLGGILFSKFGKPLLRKVKVEDMEALTKPTVYQTLDVKESRAVAVYETFCLGVIAAAGYFAPEIHKVLLPGAVGGLLIGVSQATSLMLTGNTLGISTAYEQIGDLFWWAEEKMFEGKEVPRPNINATFFAAGTAIGSLGVSSLVLHLPASVNEVQIGVLRAVIGGVLLTFGSRIAGGCTSGHGISGMSQLSISSIVTVAAIFGGGMGLAALLAK